MSRTRILVSSLAGVTVSAGLGFCVAGPGGALIGTIVFGPASAIVGASSSWAYQVGQKSSRLVGAIYAGVASMVSGAIAGEMTDQFFPYAACRMDRFNPKNCMNGLGLLAAIALPVGMIAVTAGNVLVSDSKKTITEKNSDAYRGKFFEQRIDIDLKPEVAKIPALEKRYNDLYRP